MVRNVTIYVLVFVCAIIMAAAPAAAQTHDPADSAQIPHDIVQGPHVEGHIAFLHAELGITQAQESLWAPVAAAMREDVKNLQEADAKVAPHGDQTAIQFLENRVLFANLRAQGESRFLKAFRPLYGNLSDEQKRAADELLMPRTHE